jgi:hypothetical protein
MSARFLRPSNRSAFPRGKLRGNGDGRAQRPRNAGERLAPQECHVRLVSLTYDSTMPGW